LDRERAEEAADAQADRLCTADVRYNFDARDVRPSCDGAIQQPSALPYAVGPL
jgi:hypothetical protein